MKRTITFLLIFCGGFLFSQQKTDEKELRRKVNENTELLKTNPEKALPQAKAIEKEAHDKNAYEIELEAIVNQFVHYKRNSDFKNMLATANALSEKAELYQLPLYQVMAKRYLFDAYIFSGLPDNAFQQLQEGQELMDKTNGQDSLSIMTKANLLIGFSNYYSYKKDFKNQLKYLKLSGKQAEKLPHGNHKQRWLRTYYANVGTAFKHFDLDSAKYYAELSLSKNNGKEGNNAVKAMSLSVLGEVAFGKNKYKEALCYFKQAEKLPGYKNHMNIEDLYDNLKQVYHKLNIEDSVKLYQAKIDSLNLNISNSQNQSLHKLLDEKSENNQPKYIYIFALALLVLLAILFYVMRKNKIRGQQEKASQHYLDAISENPKGLDYSKLLELLKNHDPAFMFYFNETFPGFASKLEKINPKISASEIEFCALLKLKLPAKDIAKYQYIEHQSVRNKKHIIRKKLNIPKDFDIYQFIDEL